MNPLNKFIKNIDECDQTCPEWTFNLNTPRWAYKPDQWSVAFLLGLAKVARSWKGKRVWEVGVGTGINLIVLRDIVDAMWYFSDYDPRCVPLALENLLDHSNGDKKGLHPLQGAWYLLMSPSGTSIVLPKMDIIFGCIPQVTSDQDLAVGNNASHYYNPALCPEARFNALGLGLVETLLIQARKVLVPTGKVILALSGRPGIKRLELLFTETGYRPEVLWSEMIQQHQGTSLVSFAEREKDAHGHFEFFTKDAQGEYVQLNASEAELFRVKRLALYHKIYVIAGTPA